MCEMKIKKGMAKPVLILTAIIILLLFWFSLPSKLFTDPASTVIEDKNGILLGAKIASDGQWRFPQNCCVPGKFKTAIIEFEDNHFYQHPGVNPFSLVRAVYQNIRSGKVVSGGSTLTMQVIRLMRRGKPRTIKEKIIEMILAVRLEMTHSKNDILALYASNAPFGGNVVGLDAASWRYFGQNPDNISWSEAAALAVLPNAPSLIYPGKNHYRLKKKRDRLLKNLLLNGKIDSTEYRLALAEPLPGKPLPLEQSAPHLLIKAFKEHTGERVKTTVEHSLQVAVSSVVESHHNQLKYNEIHNIAALVLDVETGNVLAYVGNTENSAHPEYGSDVDIIQAPRSTGSILKPILYASMLDAGEILPNTLIADVPTMISGFSPKNFNRKYNGAVPASKALFRSLNVPAVRMLREYGVPRFYDKLKSAGITTLNNPPAHYGLSLILGGSEATLWDLAGVYAGMSRVLNHFYRFNGKYYAGDWHSPVYIDDSASIKKTEIKELSGQALLSASSIYLTYEALLQVNRPDEFAGWKSFSSTGKIAWKTGTSFGFRDAWAIGSSPKYVVAVWVGNADGEGRSGLTGVSVAAPVMFDIFNLLPESGWFDMPYDEMVQIPVCRESGYRASSICGKIDTVWVQKPGLITGACPFCKIVHLDPSGRFRVTSECENPADMIHKSWFVLPPVMEWYFRQVNPVYKPLPLFKPGCKPNSQNPMELIYPDRNAKLYLPLELDGSKGKIVLQAAHHNPDAIIYWHIDGEYIGQTHGIHETAISPGAGKHIVTLVDDRGNSLKRRIEILTGQ